MRDCKIERRGDEREQRVKSMLVELEVSWELRRQVRLRVRENLNHVGWRVQVSKQICFSQKVCLRSHHKQFTDCGNSVGQIEVVCIVSSILAIGCRIGGTCA